MKERLSTAYVIVCSNDSVSTTTIEKAIKVLTERFEYLKIQIGCAHSKTLAVLRELVMLHWKLKTKESHAAVVKIVQDIVVEICIKEKYVDPLCIINLPYINR